MQATAFDAVRGAVLDMAAGFSVGDVWALVGYCIEALPEAQDILAGVLSEEQLTRAMDARQEATTPKMRSDVSDFLDELSKILDRIVPFILSLLEACGDAFDECGTGNGTTLTVSPTA